MFLSFLSCCPVVVVCVGRTAFRFSGIWRHMISIGTNGGENSLIGIEHLTEKEVGEFRTSAKSLLLSGPMVAPNDLTQSSAQLTELALGWRLCGIPVFPFRAELSSSELAVQSPRAACKWSPARPKPALQPLRNHRGPEPSPGKPGEHQTAARETSSSNRRRKCISTRCSCERGHDRQNYAGSGYPFGSGTSPREHRGGRVEPRSGTVPRQQGSPRGSPGRPVGRPVRLLVPRRPESSAGRWLSVRRQRWVMSASSNITGAEQSLPPRWSARHRPRIN